LLPIENHFAEVKHSELRHRELLYDWLKDEGEELGYACQELGRVAELPINLIYPRAPHAGPSLLVTGAFHGEEPSGAWGILKFLLQNSHYLKSANLSFVPIVNPTGFAAATRHNYLRQNPNRGFVPEVSQLRLSSEGEIILSHIDGLLPLASDGFLSLHEDWEQTHAYLYAFERADEPGPFSFALREALSEFFPILPSGQWEGQKVDRGVILNDSDGSFEDKLFRMGVPRTACTETPGAQPPAKRIACNSRIIQAFAEFHLALAGSSAYAAK
jgi:predicted deacylase